MSIDELARSAAHRTTATIAAASDAGSAYRELVGLRRRRAQAKVVAGAAALLTVALVLFLGTGPSHRRTEPIAPHPSDSKPFRAAPPFCGPDSFGSELSRFVTVGGDCPTGPGRYLSLGMGYATSPPFTFTLPVGWTVQPIGGVAGGDVMPALGGLLLHSAVTGSALVLAEYPTESSASGHLTDTVGTSLHSLARRLARIAFAQPTTAVRTTVGGRPGWRVDLTTRAGVPQRGTCLVVGRCAVTFALGRDPYPGRSYVGLAPGTPSTAAVTTFNSRIVLLAWTWGDPDVDHELGGVLASLDLDPPTVAPG